jgi:hypothetical protein
MPKSLTRAELDNVGCDNPDCHSNHPVIYMHPNCHPEAPTFVSFDKRSGVLTIECAECEKPVAGILVAAARPVIAEIPLSHKEENPS